MEFWKSSVEIMEINFKDKNILVTGGTGFVGSHLVEELVKQKAHVTTTFQTFNPLSYFVQQKLQDKVTLVNIDINENEKVFDLVTKANVEYIFHLAAQPLVDVAYYNPQRTLATNIMGTVNILESARCYPKVKAVIVASSDKAYGKLTKEKYLETDALRGDHPYEVSKSAADLICYSYVKTYGVPVVTTRFGNIYGEGDLNFSRIIPGMMKSLITGQVLELRSDGTFVRDYLYVKDVVRGYLQLAANIDKVKGESFNFGSSDTLSVKDLISQVEQALDTKLPYKVLNTAKNEIPYQSLDYSKIQQRIGWRPQFLIESTIKAIYAWYSYINSLE
jgi:CDP-glucose 4,6-dehydratase